MKKEIIKYPVVFFTLILVFFTYSVLVSLLPTQNIKKNVSKSISDMVEDGCYPYGIIKKKQCKLDNYSDAMILSANYGIDPKKPVLSALNPKHAAYPELSPLDAAKRQVDLEDVCLSHYPRYWHGNTFLLRPFLLFTDYSEIRWILYTVSSLLMIILSIRLFQTIGTIKTIAFFLGLFFVNIFTTQFSIQFFPVLFLSLVASILVCKHFKNRKKIVLFAFIFGCLTSYLDLLTTPILTCGLPLIIYLSVPTTDSFKQRLTTLFLFATLWGIGYACIWASKWALGTIFTDINVFKDAFETALYRTSTIRMDSRFDAIIENYRLLPYFFINLILTLLLPLAVVFFNKKEIKTNVLLFIVATFPYLWYLVLAQHAWWHWWFTYRMQAISIAAVFIIFVNFISRDKISRLFRKKLDEEKNI